MRASVCTLLLTIVIVVNDGTSTGTDNANGNAQVTNALPKHENKVNENSSEDREEVGSTSWDVSFQDLITKAKAHVNEHIAKLTNSAEQTGNVLADQAIDLVETAREKANNRMLVGRVYNKLSEAAEKNRMSVDGMVDAFSTAITAELHSWMPTQVTLPGLEMDVKGKYLCGTGGRISNLQTMKFMRSSYGDVSPEDKTIAAVLTYSFQYLHMTYYHFGSSAVFTFPVIGSLDLGFNDNEVELELDIPNVSMLSRAHLNPECLVSVKNFKVTRLATPKATIQSSSAFRTFAERMVDKFAKWHGAEFGNLFRMGVVISFHDLLKSKSKWICNTEQLQKTFELDDTNVMKPQTPDKFETYCNDKDVKDSKQKSEKESNQENTNK